MHNAGCFSGSNFLLKLKVNKTKPELFTCIKENDKTVKITHIEIDLNIIIIHSETSQIWHPSIIVLLDIILRGLG